MLQTLYQLGLVQEQDVSSLLTSVSVKHVIGMIFENSKYDKSALYEFDDPSKYLFKRDLSGRPGLFLTGNIGKQDISKLLREDRQRFIQNKIMWFPSGKIMNNLFDTLSDYRQNELKGIFEEFTKKGEQIATDVIDILTSKLPERTLLTVVIREKEGTKFVGEIQDYVELFAKGALDKKGIPEELICTVCNTSKLISAYKETPLPFFFSKKTHFFDNYSAAKGFPLCEGCYLGLQKGIKFIQDRLDYHISSVQGKKVTEAGINFWLIPSLNNYELLQAFKNDLGDKRLYYLNTLKELCKSLKSISTYDYEKREDNVDAFLRFSALFYTKDEHQLIRVLNYTQGIYPSQLQKLLEIKQKVDGQYPFRNIKREEFFIGLPLIGSFYKDIKPQWQSQVISILDKMFTGKQIRIEEIIQNINQKIHESLRESKDLGIISRISFMGLMLLEYVIYLNNNSESIGSDSNILMLNISTYETKHTERFIESHKSLLNNQTKQGVFAAGVAVAILFNVQERKYRKTAPSWDKLSRLDLDLQKVMRLIPDVKRMLGVYKINDHDTIISYLAVPIYDRSFCISLKRHDFLSFYFRTIFRVYVSETQSERYR